MAEVLERSATFAPVQRDTPPPPKAAGGYLLGPKAKSALDNLPNPVSTPLDAAHASAKGAPPAAPAKAQKPAEKLAAKKAKAKADPAPTTSANEPASPAKPPKLDTWPFPTGARV